MAVILAVLIGLSLIALRNAVVASQDFQWSGARILLAGRNPFQEYLQGDRNEFLKSQAPNYLHFYYFLLAPFAMLPATTANLAWGVANLAMLVFSCQALLRMFGRPVASDLPWLLLLALSGVPGRNAIGNGQASIFIMAALLAGLSSSSEAGDGHCRGWRPILGWMIYGLCYAKYSFLPVFATFALISFGWRAFLITLVPAAAGALAMAALFRSPAVIFQPLQVSSQTMATSYGTGDLLSLINASTGGLGSDHFRILSLFCIGLSVAVTMSARHLSLDRRLAVATVASLMFVTHLVYDYVLMTVLLAFAFSSSATARDRWTIGLAWFWIGYVHRLIWAMEVPPPILSTFLINVGLLLVLLQPCWVSRYCATAPADPVDV